MTRTMLVMAVTTGLISGCGALPNKEAYEFWQKKQTSDCVKKAKDEFDLKLCTEIDDVSFEQYESMLDEAKRDRR